jgi:hypothetical protein
MATEAVIALSAVLVFVAATAAVARINYVVNGSIAAFDPLTTRSVVVYPRNLATDAPRWSGPCSKATVTAG